MAVARCRQAPLVGTWPSEAEQTYHSGQRRVAHCQCCRGLVAHDQFQRVARREKSSGRSIRPKARSGRTSMTVLLARNSRI